MTLPTDSYVVDTMIWINLRHHYPKDIFENIWEDLGNLVSSGRLRSPDEVLKECQRGTDNFDKVLKTEFPDLFVAIDNVFLQEVAKVRLACPTLQDPNSMKNSADLHVVALASLRQATVICNEQPAKSSTDREKVPDACNHFNLRYLNWHDFLRERKRELST